MRNQKERAFKGREGGREKERKERREPILGKNRGETPERYVAS